MVCTNQLIGRRRSSTGGILICSQCCQGDVCNSNLCGETGFQLRGGPTCFACDQFKDPDACNQIQHCSRDEICELLPDISTVTYSHLYTSGCAKPQTCEKERNDILLLIQNPVCGTRCCNTSLCNSGNCNHNSHTAVSSPTPTAATANGACNPDPCIHGICFSRGADYLCDCDAGFTGQHCDISSVCHLHPCIHGICFSRGADYLCDCDAGFTGRHCDIAMGDSCSSNPCIHGTCYSNQNGYVCQCFQSYGGQNCDTTVIHSPKTQTPTSWKCDFIGVLNAIRNHESVHHPNGSACPAGGNPGESFLYQYCHPPSMDFQTWQIDIQVSAVCSQLKPGEPVGYYLNGNNQKPLGIMGVFMGCTSPTSFSIAMQQCGSGVVVEDIGGMFLNPDYFYTFDWH
ncbi:neurogenic locus notch homolog protein 1-like isoform X2 [Mya arenaria]|nr:neurogenic locus notch homolog protein 1-like isoform X2 [Mya arenaria]